MKKGCGVDGKYAGSACKKMGFLDEPSEQARANGKKAGSACKKVAGLALQESMIFFHANFIIFNVTPSL